MTSSLCACMIFSSLCVMNSSNILRGCTYFLHLLSAQQQQVKSKFKKKCIIWILLINIHSVSICLLFRNVFWTYFFREIMFCEENWMNKWIPQSINYYSFSSYIHTYIYVTLSIPEQIIFALQYSHSCTYIESYMARSWENQE